MERTLLKMRILVTGGAGFIGANYVRMLLDEAADQRVVNLDLLTYAGNLENLAGYEDNPVYRFVRGDIRDRELVRGLMADEKIDAVVHFAAESHVDRSILEPEVFVATNVLGTQNLLFLAREHGLSRFLQVSTDEVYGSLGPTGKFRESGGAACGKDKRFLAQPSPLRPIDKKNGRPSGCDSGDGSG